VVVLTSAIRPQQGTVEPRIPAGRLFSTAMTSPNRLLSPPRLIVSFASTSTALALFARRRGCRCAARARRASPVVQAASTTTLSAVGRRRTQPPSQAQPGCMTAVSWPRRVMSARVSRRHPQPTECGEGEVEPGAQRVGDGAARQRPDGDPECDKRECADPEQHQPCGHCPALSWTPCASTPVIPTATIAGRAPTTQPQIRAARTQSGCSGVC